MSGTMTKRTLSSGLVEVSYWTAPYKSREELEKEVEFWDASSASQIARCPRYGEHKIREGLRPKDTQYQLLGGKAIHAGLETYYTTFDTDLSMAAMESEWELGREFRLPPGHRFSHLHLGHLEVVLGNYFDYAKKRDTFEPLVVGFDELCLDNVVAGVFKTTEDGKVILGESKVTMRFDLDGEEFVYSGKPDLPIRMSGHVYVLDNKTTSGYLSDWYFEQFRFSNQLRGYCAINAGLMPEEKMAGAFINGLYVGERAVLREFKGTKFARYGPLHFNSADIHEALRNQLEWRMLLDYFEGRGFYPQNTGQSCRGCEFGSLCQSWGQLREAEKRNSFSSDVTEFLDL